MNLENNYKSEGLAWKTYPQWYRCWKVKGTYSSTNSKGLSNAVRINPIVGIGDKFPHLQVCHPTNMLHHFCRKDSKFITSFWNNYENKYTEF